MKKILCIISLVLLLCISCTKYDYKVNVVYDVCYPDTTIRYYKIVNVTSFEEDVQKIKVRTYSYKGTNSIIVETYSFEYTTCPIRIISYKIIN